jgi:hypothetical protein
MLWVNLIMDSFASLALATEKPTDKLLERKPYKRDSSILTPFMKANIISQGIFQILILLFIIFKGDKLFGVNSDRELEHYEWNNEHGYHFTIFFDIFVFLQVFNSINARKLNQKEVNIFEGIKDNIYYILVQSFIVFGQIILVTFGGRAVRTQPLTILQHIACAIIASLSLGVGYCVKLIPFDMAEKIVKSKDEIEIENEEEKIKKIRAEKRLLKKKSKGPNLTLRKIMLPPRNRQIIYNQIDTKNINNNNKDTQTRSPIIMDRKNRTPIYSSRKPVINTNNNNTNSSLSNSNFNSATKENNNNITNIKTIYSYNFKEKSIFSNNSNNISTEEKNLFEDLLSEETKNTENSINIKENKEKDNNINNNKKSISTPRFNEEKNKKENNLLNNINEE